MKLLVVLCLVACACAAPQPQQQQQQQNQQDVQILRYENDNSGLNSYRFAYELSDGTKREEQGELENVGTDDEALSVKGGYTWIAPDGTQYIVTFVADKNGFQPQVTVGGGGVPGAVVASLLG